MRAKKGFIPVLLVIIVLAVSSAIVYYVVRNQQKAKAATNNYPTPVGTLHVSPTTFSNKSSAYFSASEVYGANGAAVDNVRYYIINPKLGQSNAWGNPDWCANGGTCNQSTQGLVTYNIGTPANSGDYGVTWSLNTKNAESTQYDRGLSPYLLPGLYQIGLRVQDVNGNVNGNTGSIWVTITNENVSTSTPIPSASPTPTSGNTVNYCNIEPSIVFSDAYGYAPVTNLSVVLWQNSGTINVKLFNKPTGQLVVDYGSRNITSPFTGGYTTTSPGEYYFTVNSVLCWPALFVKSRTVDSDRDGFTDYIESKIGTDQATSCGVNAWPPDFNNDKVVNSIDQNLQVQHYATYIGAPNYDKRYDLNADKKINSTDQLIEAKQLGKTCS